MSRLSAENHLKLYTMLSEEAILGILTFTADGLHCVYANKLGRALLEIPADKNLDEIEVTNLFPQKVRPEFRALNEDLLKNEGLYQDVVILKQNAMTFIANLGVKKIYLDGIGYVTLMFQDITIQKKLQRDITAKQIEIKAAFEELLKQNQQLKELDLAKDRFIALTTHELRTPLSAMVASAEILKIGLYDNDEQRTEFTEVIYEQGQHLVTLINDILDFAKIQAGKMDLFVEHHDLAGLAKKLTESFEGMAESLNIKIKFNHNTEGPCTCYFDTLRLKQIFSNIVTNSIKYNKKGGSVEIWIENSDADFVKLFVKDTGKGIAPKEQDKVFNEFETLGKVALHHKGTGLGMPITKRLVEAMGGKIKLTSEVDVGSTFWVEIPKNKVLTDELYRSRPKLEEDLVA